jgi:uncharacterized membrane protein
VQLFAQAIGQLITFTLQLLVYARKFPQLDNKWIFQTHSTKAWLISAQ